MSVIFYNCNDCEYFYLHGSPDTCPRCGSENISIEDNTSQLDNEEYEDNVEDGIFRE
jgi:predicted Zn-ribbon and HTH transcriptional regulator